MRSYIAFDNLNDIVYLNCCSKFVKHVASLAVAQGLVTSENLAFVNNHGSRGIDPNILVQLFSPLVTSQRFMREQFGNPYTSVQCEDGTNIVFHDYMGFLFLRIGTEEVSFLRRALGICIGLVTYICGPDVSMLKISRYHAQLLDSLLSTWMQLYSTEQSFMLEAVENLGVSTPVGISLTKALQQATSKLPNQVGDHAQALLFLDAKLLSWSYSRGSFHLGSDDLLFLMLLCHSHRGSTQGALRRGSSSNTTPRMSQVPSSSDMESSLNSNTSKYDAGGEHSNEKSNDIHYVPDKLDCDETPGTSLNVLRDKVQAFYVLFKSDRVNFLPHLVHVGVVQDSLYLVIISEPLTSAVITATCTALQVAVEFNGSRRELVRDKQYYDLLDSSTKKVMELLKKFKNVQMRNELSVRWSRFKTGFQQYARTKDVLSVQLSPLVDIFRETFRAYFSEKLVNSKQTTPTTTSIIPWGQRSSVTNSSVPTLEAVWRRVKVDTKDFWNFLKVKASRNITMGSRDTLTINKYLEEFPGLVHFIYIDRNKHIVTMPGMDFTREDAVKLTKKKIWAMVQFARDHIQQGHFSFMWKDNAFNYAYFLWFEDITGASIRAKQSPALPWDGYPLPGIMYGDFYQRLVIECFPGPQHSKVRCLELFCIHLGLATSSCVLEHSKRLATTICEVTGTTNSATDFH